MYTDLLKGKVRFWNLLRDGLSPCLKLLLLELELAEVSALKEPLTELFDLILLCFSISASSTDPLRERSAGQSSSKRTRPTSSSQDCSLTVSMSLLIPDLYISASVSWKQLKLTVSQCGTLLTLLLSCETPIAAYSQRILLHSSHQTKTSAGH